MRVIVHQILRIGLGLHHFRHRFNLLFIEKLSEKALSDLIVALADALPDAEKAIRLRVCAAYNASVMADGPSSPPANDTGVVVDRFCSLYSDPARYLVVLLHNRSESLGLCEVTVELNRLRGASTIVF